MSKSTSTTYFADSPDPHTAWLTTIIQVASVLVVLRMLGGYQLVLVGLTAFVSVVMLATMPSLVQLWIDILRKEI